MSHESTVGYRVQIQNRVRLEGNALQIPEFGTPETLKHLSIEFDNANIRIDLA